MAKLKISLVVVALKLLQSCGGSSTDEANSINLSPCGDDYTESERGVNVQIVDDYNQSLHEMIVCGNMTYTISSAVMKFMVDLLSGNSSVIPNGVTYDGEGGYLAGSEDFTEVSMKVEFMNGLTSSLGEKDTVITPNLFEADNYLTGVSVTESELGYLVSFSDVGPLVELLGYGTEPTSPITILKTDLLNPTSFSIGVKEIYQRMSVNVLNEQNESTIAYDVQIEEGTALSQVLAGNFKYEVIDATVSRPDLQSQTLDTTSWELEFSGASVNAGSLTGSVSFSSTGGLFLFDGSLTFENSNFGTPSISCQE